ncbi:MAG: helix-turn-helix transcriptional regulator [Minicystis sp.]
MRQHPEDVAQRIGRKIVQLRRAAGLSQAALAERLGISVQRVSTIEREGNLTVYTIVAIANALGVEPIELWKEPEPEPVRARPPGRPRKPRP